MNITYITLIPSPHLYELHQVLAIKEGINLTVMYELPHSPKRDWGQFIPDCKVVWLNSIKLIGAASLLDFSVRKKLQLSKPHMIVLATSMWSINTWLIAQWAKKNHCPYIIVSEMPHHNRSLIFTTFRNFIGKILFRNAAGYAGVTQKVSIEIKKLYNFNKEVCTLPYHRDLSVYLSKSTKNKMNEIPRFLFIGELCDLKNVNLILQALSTTHYPYELKILGDGVLKKELENSAKTMCSGKVEFLGRCDYEDTHKYLFSCDYLILPSKHDGFGMVVIEALASGVPVIASDKVMSAVEFIRNNQNGWIFPSDNTKELSKTLLLAINARNQWPSMSGNARSSLDDYNANNTANSFIVYIHKILDQ